MEGLATVTKDTPNCNPKNATTHRRRRMLSGVVSGTTAVVGSVVSLPITA